MWIVWFLLGKKTHLRIRKENLRLTPALVGSIAALGVSPFIMQSTESLVNIVLNRGLQSYGGDLYVGTLTIMTSLLQFICLLYTSSLFSGFCPIALVDILGLSTKSPLENIDALFRASHKNTR